MTQANLSVRVWIDCDDAALAAALRALLAELGCLEVPRPQPDDLDGQATIALLGVPQAAQYTRRVKSHDADPLPHAMALLPRDQVHTLPQLLAAGIRDVLLVAPMDPTEARARLQVAVNAVQRHVYHLNQDSQRHRLFSLLHNIITELSGSLDRDRILDHILDNMALLVPFEFADVMTMDHNLLHIVRQRSFLTEAPYGTLLDTVFRVDETATFRQMAQTGRPIVIQDVQQDFPNWLPLPGTESVRSYLGTPLYAGERLIGFLNLNHRQPGMFTAAHADLVEIVSSVVSAAITNAQLYETVTRHAMELEDRIRDLIIVYEIGQALQASLDPKQIYILLYTEVAQRLFHTDTMRVLLVSPGGALHCAYAVQAGREITLDDSTLASDDLAAAGAVVHSGQSAISDTTVYEPLHASERVIGVLCIDMAQVDAIDEVDITLLTTITGQAAVALENAKLYARVQLQMNELSVLYSATKALFGIADLRDMSQQVARIIADKFGCEDCAVYLVEDGDLTLTQQAQAGTYTPQRVGRIAVDTTGPMHQVFMEGQPVYSPHVEHNPADPTMDARTRSALLLPLIGQRGVLGALDLQSPRADAFSEQDRRVLMAFAERAAAAIENRQLYEAMSRYASELEERVEERTAELREALRSERRMVQMKSRFVQNVSHQFRTPLTAILSASQLLERYGGKMDEAARQVRYATIRSAVNEMERLLDDSLTMSQATDGELDFEPNTMDVSELTRAIVEDFRAQDTKQHVLDFALSTLENCGIAMIDTELWQRIVKELLHNASKYSEPGTTITCTLGCDEQTIHLVVQDAGIGIPPEDLPHIFDMFHRASNVPNIYGSGLGLSIVKRAVEIHGGTIGLSSTLTVGTRVTVDLPRYVMKKVSQYDRRAQEENPGH